MPPQCVTMHHVPRHAAVLDPDPMGELSYPTPTPIKVPALSSQLSGPRRNLGVSNMAFPLTPVVTPTTRIPQESSFWA